MKDEFEKFDFKKPRENLTLVELKELWELHNEGWDYIKLAFYFRISHRCAHESLVAAKHLHGGGLKKLMARLNSKRIERSLNAKNEPLTNPITRPQPFYTNQSEWQRFVNTGS